MKLKSKYTESDFLKNIFTLLMGTSISQVVPIIVSPFLSRLYNPQQFGELAIILSIVSLFSIVSTFQYESAIMLPKKDKNAFNLLVLSVLIAFTISILIFTLSNLFIDQILYLFPYQSLTKWIFFIPLFILLDGLFNSLNMWLIRDKKYKEISFINVSSASLGSFMKLSLGYFKYIASGLILATLLSKLISTFAMLYIVLKTNWTKFHNVNFNKLKNRAIEFQEFPKFTMWQGFFDLLNASGVIFIIGYYYGVTIVGLYSFTLGILMKPIMMIGKSVSQVFYQNVSMKVSNDIDIYDDTISITKHLLFIGLIIFLPIITIGPQIFSKVFGQKWLEAGMIAQIMSPWILLRFIASPISKLSLVLNKQKDFFIITTIMNILHPTIFLVVGWFNKDYISAFIISSIFMTFYLFLTIIYILGFTKKGK